jgi:hypothetical protein
MLAVLAFVPVNDHGAATERLRLAGVALAAAAVRLLAEGQDDDESEEEGALLSMAADAVQRLLRDKWDEEKNDGVGDSKPFTEPPVAMETEDEEEEKEKEEGEEEWPSFGGVALSSPTLRARLAAFVAQSEGGAGNDSGSGSGSCGPNAAEAEASAATAAAAGPLTWAVGEAAAGRLLEATSHLMRQRRWGAGGDNQRQRLALIGTDFAL